MFSGLSGIEAFLVDKFFRMPKKVRVITYYVFLFLYVYLILVPKFMNGQLVAKTETGGLIPYRGVDLQTYIEGRVLKYKSNEDGFWSIPIISLLPHPVRIQVYHEDEGVWFPVDFSRMDFWKFWLQDSFQFVITNNPPGVNLAELSTWVEPSQAEASVAILRRRRLETINPTDTLDNKVIQNIQEQVFQVVSEVLKIPPQDLKLDFRLVGDSGPTYIQRIQIVEKLEKTLEVKIPDEHWRSFYTIGELIKYLEAREVIKNIIEKEGKSPTPSDWPSIQQNAPPDQIPIFKE